MAQNFRTITRNTGTSAVDALGGAANSFDTLISVRMANTTTSTIQVDAFIKRSSTDYYLIKNAPIVSGGSLELIDGGSKIVLASRSVVCTIRHCFFFRYYCWRCR